MSDRSTAHPLTILVIEDHPDVADTLALFLRLAGGCEVEVAYDGQAGLAAALRTWPDAIVCDLGLPDRNGFAVAEAVLRGLPYKPLLVAVSAYSDEAIQGRARWAGFDHFLVKPADPLQIEGLIRQHAARGPAHPAGSSQARR